MATAEFFKIYIKFYFIYLCTDLGFPGGSASLEASLRASLPDSQAVENPPAIQETRFDPMLGTSPREGNGNPLQYSCPGNPTDRGAWWATVCGVARVEHDLATNT